MAVYRPSALKLTKDGTQDQYIIDLTTRVAVQQSIADAGKALGINNLGQVVPVPFSGDDFTGATESTAGVHGYVPAPAAGDQEKVLYGDGTWKDIESAARVIEATHSIVNESGAYNVTIQDDRISTSMMCIMMEISDPTVVHGRVSVTCGSGTITVSCPEIVGETSLVMRFIKGTDESQVITSEEFDILNNRLTAVDSALALLNTDFTGATASTDGAHGLVPAPRTTNVDNVLMSDGAWHSEVPMASHAQYARQIETEDAQSSSGEYIYRTTGGSASLSDGDAMLIKLRGRRVHTGYSPEQITYSVGRVDPESDLAVELDKDTMRAYLGNVDVDFDYFTYSENDGWVNHYGGRTLSGLGFTITGTPAEGDAIGYTYHLEHRGVITQSNPTIFVSTGWNLYNHHDTYARVVKYSDDYGFKIGGTYTAVKFSETLSGTKTTIIPASGYFTVPSDGYVWVEGGNDTDTYVMMTWSDWTEGYEGSWQEYTTSTVSLATVMLNVFPYGLCQVGDVSDEIDLNLGTVTKNIGRMAYSAENLAIAEAFGRPYECDTSYIYYVLETQVVTSMTVDGSFTASDHGMEFIDGTSVPVYVETLYGQNLVDKLRTDVLTKSSDLVNNLTTNDGAKALSAAQGYALNQAIANVASYESKGNFNSDSSLQTILTTVLSGMGTDSTKLIRLNCNGSFGVFGNGLVYAVDVKKYTDTYAAFLFQTVGYAITIAGSKNNNTWTWQQLVSSNLPLLKLWVGTIDFEFSNTYYKAVILSTATGNIVNDTNIKCASLVGIGRDLTWAIPTNKTSIVAYTHDHQVITDTVQALAVLYYS